MGLVSRCRRQMPSNSVYVGKRNALVETGPFRSTTGREAGLMLSPPEAMDRGEHRGFCWYNVAAVAKVRTRLWMVRRMFLSRRMFAHAWSNGIITFHLFVSPGPIRRWATIPKIAMLLALASGHVNAADQEGHATGWSFYIDNDYFSAGLSSDQGYTGGFALNLSGQRAVEYPWSLDSVLSWVNRATGWSSLYTGVPHAVQHSWQIGTVAFTPDEIDISKPIPGDRPYAGMAFIGNTRQVRRERRQISYFSSIRLGVLGTSIPKAIQNGLHDMADDEKARGWKNQISDGGELTFLWKVQRKQTHWSRHSPERFDYELKSVVSASAGYSTQVGAGIIGRWGRFTSWWTSDPTHAEYINFGVPTGSRGPSEFYVWAGVHLRQRFYNAFLEGQFRESEVTFDRSAQLDSTLWELNLGATWSASNGYYITMALRAIEDELPDSGGREAWGSLIFGRKL